MCLLKIKNKLKIGCFFQIKSGRILNNYYFVGVVNIKTVFPLMLAGYVMIIANSYPTRTRGLKL